MGFAHTAQLRLSIALERLQGLDFTRANQQPSELGLDDREVFIPSPSGGRHLRRVLADLDMPPGCNALDIGCAKGSAMRDLLRHPFAAVDGLELSPELAAIARRNFLKLGETRATVHCSDARHFQHYADYRLFYLYNPFPPEVLEQVLHTMLPQLADGVQRTVVYNNPTGHDLMLRHGLQPQRRYPDFWGHGIQVYTHTLPAGTLLRH
jgi:hypothetical protein